MKTGNRKKILIGIITAAAVVAGAWIVLLVVRRANEKPVRVYKVSDVAQTDYWADQQETYGVVATDQLQNVFLTSTQTVSRVFVQKGQQVKAGDPLLAYDTTLSEINIEKAENDVNQQKRTLDLARKELLKMQNTKPVDERKVVPPTGISGNEADDPEEHGGEEENSEEYPEDVPNGENETGEDYGGENGHGTENPDSPNDEPEQPSEENTIWTYHPDTNYQGEEIGEARTYKTPALLDGIGTTERPAIWIWSEDDELSDDLLKKFFNDTLTARKKEEAGSTDEEESDKSDMPESKDQKADVKGLSVSENRTDLVGRAFSDSDHDVYIVLRQYMENNPAHKELAEHGLHLELKDGKLDVSLFNPELLKVREANAESGASSIEETTESGSAIEDDSSGTDGNLTDDGGNDLEYGSDIREGDDGGIGEPGAESDALNANDSTDALKETSDGSISSDALGDGSENYEAMTRKELNQAISDQKIKIRDQEITEKLAEIKLRQMKHEVSDGIVRSKISGVVKNVRDPETAYEKNKACVTVSNGGGYKINCPVSELSLSGIKKGMSATVTSTDNGESEDGMVVSVSGTPSSGGGYGSSNNPNVSYYDCVVRLPDSANLKENDFVSVSFGNGASSRKGLFLDSMFIRSDDGGSYVYIRGKDQKLKKQYIRTGRDIGGGTMEILKGLTISDKIAFPYGSNVEDGAKTKNSSTEELYS